MHSFLYSNEKFVLRANDLFISLLRKLIYSSWAFPEGVFMLGKIFKVASWNF